jgi:hypothetical protein
MDDRLASLERQLVIYRHMLREGSFSQQAAGHFRRILELEEELRHLRPNDRALPPT